MTTRFAGRFTPAASVVVHARTRTAPRLNPSSIASFSRARSLAWWNPTPVFAAASRTRSGNPSAAAMSRRSRSCLAAAVFFASAGEPGRANRPSAAASASARSSAFFRDGQNTKHESPRKNASAASLAATPSGPEARSRPQPTSASGARLAGVGPTASKRARGSEARRPGAFDGATFSFGVAASWFARGVSSAAFSRSL